MPEQVYRFIKFLKETEGKDPPPIAVVIYGEEKEKTKEIQLAAIQENPSLIKYIKNPKENVIVAAIKENGHLIKYIKNPSAKVQRIAIAQNGFFIEYIDNPNRLTKLFAYNYIKTYFEKVKNKPIPNKYKAYFTDSEISDFENT